MTRELPRLQGVDYSSLVLVDLHGRSVGVAHRTSVRTVLARNTGTVRVLRWSKNRLQRLDFAPRDCHTATVQAFPSINYLARTLLNKYCTKIVDHLVLAFAIANY